MEAGARHPIDVALQPSSSQEAFLATAAQSRTMTID
jgi:hypothetical protein